MNEQLKQDLLTRAEEVLSELRPHLWSDEGDVKILDLNDDFELILQWQGACNSCRLSHLTLKYGLKSAVMEQIEEIRDVTVAS
jgi:Fe-S cluster biogenesis protein NfuA